MNRPDLSSEPPLTQGILLKLLLEKVENLVDLTLHLLLVILKSLSRIVVLVDVSIKEVVS